LKLNLFLVYQKKTRKKKLPKKRALVLVQVDYSIFWAKPNAQKRIGQIPSNHPSNQKSSYCCASGEERKGSKRRYRKAEIKR